MQAAVRNVLLARGSLQIDVMLIAPPDGTNMLVVVLPPTDLAGLLPIAFITPLHRTWASGLLTSYWRSDHPSH